MGKPALPQQHRRDTMIEKLIVAFAITTIINGIVLLLHKWATGEWK
jgi:hypothetical protein